MTLEIKDLAGLSEPMTKLVDVVSSAIGTMYKPSAIRNEADARAYELKVLTQARAEADEDAKRIAIIGAKQRIELLSNSNPELVERARNRLLTKELEAQLNIEAIADEAAKQLPASVSSEPISKDWRRKFFQEAENICESDMQIFWGKILAGEIATPGKFSLRTLETLKNISQREAGLFRTACSLAMKDGWIAIPGHDLNKVFEPYGLSYGNIIELRDAGLIVGGDNLTWQLKREQIIDPIKFQLVLDNNGVLIQISGAPIINLSINSFFFTKAGREIQALIEVNPLDSYFVVLGGFLRQKGLVVKRGTPVPRGEGVSLITFDQDL